MYRLHYTREPETSLVKTIELIITDVIQLGENRIVRYHDPRIGHGAWKKFIVYIVSDIGH